MPLSLTPAGLREFGKIPDSESDSLLQQFIDPAVKTIERMTGKAAADLDSPESKLAARLLALNWYQSRDFPSAAVNEAVYKQVIGLISADLDIGSTLIYTRTDSSSRASRCG